MPDRGWSLGDSAGIGWSAPPGALSGELQRRCERVPVAAPTVLLVDQPEWEAPWLVAEGEPPTVSIDRRLAASLTTEDVAGVVCLVWAQKLCRWERISWARIGHLGAAVCAPLLARFALPLLGPTAGGALGGLGAFALSFVILDWPFVLMNLRGMPGRLATARTVVAMLGSGSEVSALLGRVRQALGRIPGSWRIRRGWGLCGELDCLYDAVASVTGLPKRTSLACLSDYIMPPPRVYG